MSAHSENKLIRSAPYFPVADVDRTVAFYEDIFGFTVEYTAGTPMQFAICSRDGLALMFRKVSEPALICPGEEQGGAWDAFFWTDNAEGLHGELEKKGADVVYGPIIQEAYQMREFAVRDPDGHILGFGQTL